MEQIKIYLEQMISLTGLSGDSVAVVRYGILVVSAFVLAWLAGCFADNLWYQSC